MQTHTSRGRTVHTRKGQNPVQVFYIVLAIVAIAGVAALSTVFLGSRTAQAPTTTANPGTSAQATAALDSYPSKGSTDAPVTVVEYSDFQCPACAYFATTQEASIMHDYVDTGKVRFIYHDFPLPQHGNAILATEAARAAGEQNAFWPMHDLLFAKQTEWENLPNAQQQFIAYAQQLNLDVAKFSQSLSSGKYRATAVAAQQDSENVGINATPSFVINGNVYNASDLRSAIDTALAAKK